MGADAAGFISSGAYLSYLRRERRGGVGGRDVRRSGRCRARCGARCRRHGGDLGRRVGAGAGGRRDRRRCGCGTGLPALRRPGRPARSPDRSGTAAWSAISSGTGWGVAVAGPIAVVAGDQWRVAWGGVRRPGRAGRRRGGAGSPPPTSDDALRPPAAELDLVLLPAVASVAVLGGRRRGDQLGLVGVRRRRDAIRPGWTPHSARVVYAACGVARRARPRSAVRASRPARPAHGVPGHLRVCSPASLAVFGLAAAPRARRRCSVRSPFGVFYCAVIAAQGSLELAGVRRPPGGGPGRRQHRPHRSAPWSGRRSPASRWRSWATAGPSSAPP